MGASIATILLFFFSDGGYGHNPMPFPSSIFICWSFVLRHMARMTVTCTCQDFKAASANVDTVAEYRAKHNITVFAIDTLSGRVVLVFVCIFLRKPKFSISHAVVLFPPEF